MAQASPQPSPLRWRRRPPALPSPQAWPPPLCPPLLFSLPPACVCRGSPAGRPSVVLRSCSPAVPTAPPGDPLTASQPDPKQRETWETRPTLCVGFVHRRCPGARPGLRSSRDAGPFRRRPFAAMACHRQQASSRQTFYGSPEFVSACHRTPVELCGPGLLHVGEFVTDWIPSGLLSAPWSRV